MRGPVVWTLAALLSLAALACGQRQETLTVFAAASLSDALEEAADLYARERDVRVRLSFGGSNLLARQIALGARPDAFIPAGPQPLASLRERGLVEVVVPDLVTNRLVVAVRRDAAFKPASMEDLASQVERVAIADPDLAPAGRYGREALTALGLWERLEGRLVLGANARATLALVEAGNAQAALVYATDVRAAPSLEALDLVPDEAYTPVRYPAAVVVDSPRRELAADFLRFLASDQGAAVLRGYGFTAGEEPTEAPRPPARVDYLRVVTLTLQVAAVATALDLPLALVVGWFMTRGRFRGRLALDVLVTLPLALPPVTTGFFLLWLLGRRGPIGSVLASAGVEVTFTWVAASLAAALVSFPLMARTVVTALEGVDRRLELTARSLGAGPWRVAFTVTLPLAYRGIVAGVLLGFVRAVGEFGATIVVAGNIPGSTQTLPLAIYSRVILGDMAAALRLVILSALLAVASLMAYYRLLSPPEGRTRGPSGAR